MANTIKGGVFVLKIVIVRQFFTCHYSVVFRKKGHSRFSRNSPFLHPAIGLARVVNKTCNRAPCGIDDHVLVKIHEIVALQRQARLALRYIQTTKTVDKPRYFYIWSAYGVRTPLA